MMSGKAAKTYGFLPRVALYSHSVARNINWEMIDQKIKKQLDISGVGIPSVRVGICWVLEYFVYKKSNNHVLVPKFLSRCILNAINRYALPVEDITSDTSLALIVDQFGFQQDLEAIEREVQDRNIMYIEDTANSIRITETTGKKSYGKLIGFSKVLPILKGGVLISSNKPLLDFVRKKREEKFPVGYSWFIFMVLAQARHTMEKIQYSALVDLAYEAYLQSPRDNRALLNNFWAGLDMVEEYAEITQERISLIKKLLGEKTWFPDADRLANVVLMPPGNKETEIVQVFNRNHFDSTLYHHDVNKNIFRPEYKKVFLIPLNPTIPKEQFNNFIEELTLIKGL